MNGILGTLNLTQKAALAIPHVLNKGFFGLLVEPYHVLRAENLAFPASITFFMIYPADSHVLLPAVTDPVERLSPHSHYVCHGMCISLPLRLNWK